MSLCILLYEFQIYKFHSIDTSLQDFGCLEAKLHPFFCSIFPTQKFHEICAITILLVFNSRFYTEDEINSTRANLDS